MKIERESLVLQPLCGWDQLRFQNNVSQLMGGLTTLLGDFEQARAVAENCVLVYCATRGQLDGVNQPADLLYALDLEDLAALAAEYDSLGGVQEWGFNESFPQGVDER